MSFEEQIEALRSRHAELETALRGELSRPSPDDNHLHELKRQKLRIKDTIAQLAAGQHPGEAIIAGALAAEWRYPGTPAPN